MSDTSIHVCDSSCVDILVYQGALILLYMCVTALVLCVTGVGGVGRRSEAVYTSICVSQSSCNLVHTYVWHTPLLLLVYGCATGVSGAVSGDRVTEMRSVDKHV